MDWRCHQPQPDALLGFVPLQGAPPSISPFYSGSKEIEQDPPAPGSDHRWCLPRLCGLDSICFEPVVPLSCDMEVDLSASSVAVQRYPYGDLPWAFRRFNAPSSTRAPRRTRKHALRRFSCVEWWRSSCILGFRGFESPLSRQTRNRGHRRGWRCAEARREPSFSSAQGGTRPPVTWRCVSHRAEAR